MAKNTNAAIVVGDFPKTHPVYRSADIKAIESDWFLRNASFDLMRQAAWRMAQIVQRIAAQSESSKVLLWCGAGNNGGDGYLIARYLKQSGVDARVFAPTPAQSDDAKRARSQAAEAGVPILDRFLPESFDAHVDALFGSGLNRLLSPSDQQTIALFNAQKGKKIAVDVPSGLHPDTGVAMPCAAKVDFCLSLIALKMGLLTGQGRHYAGKIVDVDLLPVEIDASPVAYMRTKKPTRPRPKDYIHKGDNGSALVIGGNADMGGAALLAAYTAQASGAGKLTLVCHKKHHGAALATNAGLMTKDIDAMGEADFLAGLANADAVCFGMGLGRDAWSEQVYTNFMAAAGKKTPSVAVLDADALYFLAKSPQKFDDRWILTPHAAEAARLLRTDVAAIDADRLRALWRLRQTYGGNWVLKGAGSLSYDNGEVRVCPFGNPFMATAGMGDTLAGAIAALRSFMDLGDCVSAHALAADFLAKKQRPIAAKDMPKAIGRVLRFV